MSQAYTTIEEWEEFSDAFEQFCDIVSHLRSPSQQLDHGQVEQVLDTQGRAPLRRLLQGHLDYCAAQELYWDNLEGSI